MNIFHILSIMIAGCIVLTRLEGSESEVLRLVASDPVASKLVADFDFFPKIIAQADSQSKEETLEYDRYFTTYTLLAASRFKDSKLPCQGWSHWVEVKIERSASNEFLNVRGVSFTALRRGDSWPCFFTEKILRLDEKNEVTVLPTSEKSPAVQANSDQTATRPEMDSVDGDKAHPESEGRSP